MATATDEYDEEAPQVGIGDFFGAIHRFLHNKKVGLALILAMGVLSLLGILIDQVDPTVRSDPDMYSSWLEQTRSKYGGWTGVLDTIGFFHMFSSPLYLAVLVMLALSIIACTVHRIPVLWRNAVHPKTRVTTGFYSRARMRAQAVTPLGVDEAHDRVRSMLSGARFRVVADPERPDQLYADRFRFAPFGTVLAHAAFIVILVGFIIIQVVFIVEVGVLVRFVFIGKVCLVVPIVGLVLVAGSGSGLRALRGLLCGRGILGRRHVFGGLSRHVLDGFVLLVVLLVLSHGHESEWQRHRRRGPCTQQTDAGHAGRTP